MMTLLAELGVKSELAQQGIGLLIIIMAIKLTNNALIFRLYDYAVITLEMQIQEYLYNQLFHYIHGHSVGFFAENFSGSLITKVRKCIWAMERFTDMIFWNILPFVLNLLIILIVIGQKSLLISGGMLVFVIVFAFVQYRLTKWLQPYQDRANTLDTELGGVLSDTITNALTVKIFSALSREEATFSQTNKSAVDARKTQYYKSMRLWGTSFILVVILEFFVMRYAITLWGKGVIEIWILFLVHTYLFRIIDQIMGISQIFRAFSRTVSEIWDALEILQTPRAIQDRPNALPLEIKNAKIAFDKVDFAYGEEKVFEDLSFEIQSGEHIALVGASGSGKSTITKLLFRFYDIQKGQILIDDQDIAQVSQESLRSKISLVPQDPVLFHRSIRDNIAYARPDASDQEVIAAAKMARCDLFIENFPEKYDTLVGERGVKLSWGERQRIAIARAILENAPILVMDEATSALDSESEKYIQEAMHEVMKHKTTIVIAHRLSTIMKMDKIIVMDQGKIAETWTHSELIANSEGIYYKLWNIQSGGFIS